MKSQESQKTAPSEKPDLNLSLDDVIGKRVPMFPKKTVGKKSKKKKKKTGANGSIVRTAYGMLKGYVNDPGQKKSEQNMKLLNQVLEILEKVEPKSKKPASVTAEKSVE